jgi:hypothetical protein
MIWIYTTILLYLLISGIALFLICDGEPKHAYFDIRNIITAICWPAVLIFSAIGWLVKKLSMEKKEETK